jgi:hypothetical protein
LHYFDCSHCFFRPNIRSHIRRMSHAFQVVPSNQGDADCRGQPPVIACGGGASADQAALTRVAAAARAPAGAYESRLPDGTVIRLSFRDGGAVRIAMTEDGKTNSHDRKWILNGEVILVEGGEGMTLQ